MAESGRPHAVESQRRALEYARLVAMGCGLKDAARASGVSFSRALDLAEDPSWGAVVDGFREAA